MSSSRRSQSIQRSRAQSAMSVAAPAGCSASLAWRRRVTRNSRMRQCGQEACASVWKVGKMTAASSWASCRLLGDIETSKKRALYRPSELYKLQCESFVHQAAATFVCVISASRVRSEHEGEIWMVELRKNFLLASRRRRPPLDTMSFLPRCPPPLQPWRYRGCQMTLKFSAKSADDEE